MQLLRVVKRFLFLALDIMARVWRPILSDGFLSSRRAEIGCESDSRVESDPEKEPGVESETNLDADGRIPPVTRNFNEPF